MENRRGCACLLWTDFSLFLLFLFEGGGGVLTNIKSLISLKTIYNRVPDTWKMPIAYLIIRNTRIVRKLYAFYLYFY